MAIEAHEMIQGLNDALEAMDAAYTRLDALDERSTQGRWVGALYARLDELNKWARATQVELLEVQFEHPFDDGEYMRQLNVVYNGMRERLWRLAAIPELGDAAVRMGQPTEWVSLPS